MYLIGDIGNTETKIFLINERLKVINHKTIKTSLISFRYLYKNLIFLEQNKKKIKTILFSSVVPITYKILKKFIKKKN